MTIPSNRILSHDWFPQPIPDNVVLGANTWCYSSFAFLHYQSVRPCGVRVGHDSGIYHGTFFDLDPEGEVEIGNFVTLVGVIIASSARIVIRDYAFLAHEVVLADHFAAVPSPRASGSLQSEQRREPAIEVGENSWIGARAVLLKGARIGANAIVGAAAVVDSEIPPFTIAAGNPARVVGAVR